MFVARGRFALKTSLSPALFCWWNPWFPQIVFPPPRLQKPCSQGCSRSREGGCVPGTHWNWNKAQPLESLHSPVHTVLQMPPLWTALDTCFYLYLFFFSPLSSKVSRLWSTGSSSQAFCLRTPGYLPSSVFFKHHFLLHIKVLLLFGEKNVFEMQQ